MPDTSPFTSAAKTETPAVESCSAITWSVLVLPVPVAPATRPWRFIVASGSRTAASGTSAPPRSPVPSSIAPPFVAYAAAISAPKAFGSGALSATGRDRSVVARLGSVSARSDVTVHAPDEAGVLTPEALDLVVALQREFAGRREELLLARAERQERIAAGELPDFLEETRSVREGDWRVAPVPDDLRDRRVEITGPAGDRKMVINAFNSGARIYMADFEDANSPTWANVLGGQQNLTDAIDRTISLESGGKSYALNDEVATLLVRPRGWHLPGAQRRGRRQARLRGALRLRPVPAAQRRAAARARIGAVLLPPEAREPPRGAPLERRLLLRAGSRSASRAARSRRPSSSRRSSPPSRWTRSCTSSATTRPA